MADQERSPEDSIEIQLAKARKGAGAESGRAYLSDFLWARLWRSVTAISNCRPELSELLHHRAEISACMKLAQEIQIDMANAEIVNAKMKSLFTHRVTIPS